MLKVRGVRQFPIATGILSRRLAVFICSSLYCYIDLVRLRYRSTCVPWAWRARLISRPGSRNVHMQLPLPAAPVALPVNPSFTLYATYSNFPRFLAFGVTRVSGGRPNPHALSTLPRGRRHEPTYLIEHLLPLAATAKYKNQSIIQSIIDSINQ